MRTGAVPAASTPRRGDELLAGAEVLVLCLAAPVLLFPRGPLPLVGLVAILVVRAAGLLVRRRAAVGTPLDLPLLLLLVMALQALYPSVDRALSLPKLYGLVLGVAVFYGVANGVRSPRAWWMGIGVLVAAMVGVAALGAVSTSWIAGKLPLISALYTRIPRLVPSVESSFGTVAGIHPNELGGTLAFLLPVPLAVLLWSAGTQPMAGSGANRRWRRIGSPRMVSIAAALATLLATLVLVLTYSRSGLLGFGAALLLLVALRWRRGWRLAASVAGLLIVASVVVGTRRMGEWALQLDPVARGSTLVARGEIWERARYMIEDFPFTGIGLNTFPRVLDALYPSFMAGPEARIPHAHNIYLQTAVDLGLAGFMAFVGLWMIVGRQAVRSYRRAEGPSKGAVAGLGAGCLAYLIYGLTDAITLGAKPLPLLWAMVGLIVAAGRLPAGPDLAPEACAKAPAPDGRQLESARGNPHRRGLAAGAWGLLGRRALPREAGAALWELYWMVAILFAAMAYLVLGLTASGWAP